MNTKKSLKRVQKRAKIVMRKLIGDEMPHYRSKDIVANADGVAALWVGGGPPPVGWELIDELRGKFIKKNRIRVDYGKYAKNRPQNRGMAKYTPRFNP